MTETEGLAWKQDIRAADRGSVYRIVGQVYESLEPGEALNLLRLRQQKSQLSGKLDDELIEMVAEDELDTEVDQADIIKEKIGLCIMDIELALERASSYQPPLPIEIHLIRLPRGRFCLNSCTF